RRLEGLRPARGDRHVRAFTGQLERRGATDAEAPARDERALPLESEPHRRHRASAVSSSVAPRPGESESFTLPVSNRSGAVTTSPSTFAGPTDSHASRMLSLID